MRLPVNQRFLFITLTLLSLLAFETMAQSVEMSSTNGLLKSARQLRGRLRTELLLLGKRIEPDKNAVRISDGIAHDRYEIAVYDEHLGVLINQLDTDEKMLSQIDAKYAVEYTADEAAFTKTSRDIRTACFNARPIPSMTYAAKLKPLLNEYRALMKQFEVVDFNAEERYQAEQLEGWGRNTVIEKLVPKVRADLHYKSSLQYFRYRNHFTGNVRFTAEVDRGFYVGLQKLEPEEKFDGRQPGAKCIKDVVFVVE